MHSQWPFMKQGLDIVGSLLNEFIQKKFIFATINYFTKWVEAKSYGNDKTRMLKPHLEEFDLLL